MLRPSIYITRPSICTTNLPICTTPSMAYFPYTPIPYQQGFVLHVGMSTFTR